MAVQGSLREAGVTQGGRVNCPFTDCSEVALRGATDIVEATGCKPEASVRYEGSYCITWGVFVSRGKGCRGHSRVQQIITSNATL